MASYATLSDLDRKTQRGVQSTLFNSEEFLGAIDVYDSLLGRKRTKLVLTEQRIIEFKRGFIRQSTVDYDRDRISNISFDKGIIYRKLGISGTGFNEKWYVDYEAGQRFASAARSNEPQKVLDKSENRTHNNIINEVNAEETETSADIRPDSASEGQREVSPEPVELPGFTDSIPENDNYHYGGIAAIVLALVASSAGISSLVVPLVLAASVLVYFDTVHVRRTSSWRPTEWLYALGTFLLFIIAMPIYYYRRHKHIGL